MDPAPIYWNAKGELSIRDASIRYESEFDAIENQGGVGIYHDTGEHIEQIADDTILGSAAVLHKETGRSVAPACGQPGFDPALPLDLGTPHRAKPKEHLVL